MTSAFATFRACSMQADMDDIVYVRFTGPIVDQLLEIDRELYESCVIMERGEKVIYVELP